MYFICVIANRLFLSNLLGDVIINDTVVEEFSVTGSYVADNIDEYVLFVPSLTNYWQYANIVTSASSICDHKRHYYQLFIDEFLPIDSYVVDNVGDYVMFIFFDVRILAIHQYCRQLY